MVEYYNCSIKYKNCNEIFRAHRNGKLLFNNEYSWSFLINPVGQYINRYTHQWYEEKKIMNVFFVFNFYVVFMAFISLFITFLLYKTGIGNNVDMFYFILFVSLYIYFNTWNQTIIPMINLLGNRVSFIYFTISTQIFGLLLSVYFINYWDFKGV